MFSSLWGPDGIEPMRSFIFLNKKANPQGAAKKVNAKTMHSSEWGYVIPLNLDDDHVLRPDAWTGKDGSSHDIVLIRIPDKHQATLIAYMDDKQEAH